MAQQKNNSSPVNQDTKPYGQELILDFEDVDISRFNPKFIEQFCRTVVKSINMEAGPFYLWGNPSDENEPADPKCDGMSCVLFLEHSSMTCHFLDRLNKVFVNIFSCDDFDSFAAIQLCQKKLGGKLVSHRVVTRL